MVATKAIKDPLELAAKVAAVGVALYGTYYFATHLDLFLKNKRQAAKYSKEITQKPTYPPTQYDSWADSLEKAWYPTVFGFGTDEGTVYSIISRLRNNTDWLMLQRAYGVRPYYQGGFEYAKYNLVQSINIEDEGGEMRKKINQLLAKKGIKYRV